jgi:hypothetical protein
MLPSFFLCIFLQLKARLGIECRPSVLRRAEPERRAAAHSNASRSRSSGSSECQSPLLPTAALSCYSPSHLDEILTNAELRLDFEKFCAVEFADENLAFLHACDEFTSSFYDMSKSARTIRFKKIVSTFVAPDGRWAVNLPGRQIDALLALAEEEVGYDAFNDARKEVANLLELGQARRFRSNSKT